MTKINYLFNEEEYPTKIETLIQCNFNVGPASQTMEYYAGQGRPVADTSAIAFMRRRELACCNILGSQHI